MKKLSLAELQRPSLDEFKTLPKLPIVVILDNLRSLSNVGSIFRTADAFLVEKIILGGITGAPPHREIHKTALGATESVQWEHVEDTLQAIQQLSAQGYTPIAFEQTDDSQPLLHFTTPIPKVALIFGNEVQGVQEDVLSLAHYAVEIPQYGTKHSLNVAVAAGIGIFYFAQRYLPTR